MKTLKYTLLSIIILSIYSCGKYEEGPGFTILSKSARMCQKWRPIQSVDGSTDVITNIESDGSYIEFVKDGSIQFYNKDQMSFLGIDAVAGGTSLGGVAAVGSVLGLISRAVGAWYNTDKLGKI